MSQPRSRPAPEVGPRPPPVQAGPDPDQALLERIRDGEQAAYASLLDRHLGPIHALALRMLGNAADAEEVGQDTFLRAWRQIPGWKPGAAKFSTWLYRVALNLCHDRLRRRRDTRPIEDVDPPSRAPGPEHLARHRDLEARVRAALQDLPQRQREAIVLSHYQELSQREAAAVLEVSVEALESLLARGRRTLREALADHCDDITGAHDGH